jgi:hypothetical protein
MPTQLDDRSRYGAGISPYGACMTRRPLHRLDMAITIALGAAGLIVLAVVPRHQKIWVTPMVLGIGLLKSVAVEFVRHRRRAAGGGLTPQPDGNG